MSAAPLLQVDDVWASYGKSTVLRGIDLEVDGGEVVALLGRNGVGKTTTLRVISGVLPVERGVIRFEGADITDAPDYEISRRGISLVPEDRAVFSDLTVEENLRMGTITKQEGILSLDEVYEILPRLHERRSLSAANLSGGEKQMLAIARALVKHTELLLLDEPTEGLAPLIVEQIHDLIERIKALGIPILLVEPNLEVAVSTADRCYILEKGEIVFEDDIEALVGNASLQQQYLGVGTSMRQG